MKTKISLAILSVIVLDPFKSAAQHGHLNAGALGTNQNDKLFFANGADFVDSSGYVKTLTFTNGGRFAGYYEGNITLTSILTGTSTAAASLPRNRAFTKSAFRCSTRPAMELTAGGGGRGRMGGP